MTPKRIPTWGWCDRTKGRPHELVRLEVETGETFVVTQEAQQRPAGRVIAERRYRVADMEGFDSLTATVTCPCGRSWSVDLVPIFRGLAPPLRREAPFDAHGVSSRRYKRP